MAAKNNGEPRYLASASPRGRKGNKGRGFGALPVEKGPFAADACPYSMDKQHGAPDCLIFLLRRRLKAIPPAHAIGFPAFSLATQTDLEAF